MAGRKSRIEFPKDMRIEGVQQVFADAQTVIEEGKANVALDLRKVVSIDAAGFQLLVAMCQQLENQGRQFEWMGEQEHFENAELGGFTQVLGWS